MRNLPDAMERAVWTAVEAGLAVLVLTDVSTLRACGVAALGALLAAVKAYAKTRIRED